MILIKQLNVKLFLTYARNDGDLQTKKQNKNVSAIISVVNLKKKIQQNGGF